MNKRQHKKALKKGGFVYNKELGLWIGWNPESRHCLGMKARKPCGNTEYESKWITVIEAEEMSRRITQTTR